MTIVGYTYSSGASGSGWSNLGNLVSTDSSYADSGSISPFNSFGELTVPFTIYGIPGGATIDGIQVGVTRKAGSALHFYDSDVHIVVNGANGSNKADANAWSTTDESINYGGGADLHGLTPTVADLEASFSVKFTASNNGIMPDTAYYDVVSLSIFYTEPASGAAVKMFHMQMQGMA